MMKSVLLFSTISILAVASVGASADSLKPFVFKSVISGVDTDPKSIGRCETPSHEGLVKCASAEKSVAGIGTDAPKIYFYNNRLHKVFYRFNTNNFDKLNKALNEKYGAPCEQTTEELPVSDGKVIDNLTASWCFQTGKLTLKAMDKEMKYGSLTYIDKNKPPLTKTLVDF